MRKKGNESTIHYELTTMYLMNSEHVVRLYDHFEDAVNVYLVMEFVDGVIRLLSRSNCMKM